MGISCGKRGRQERAGRERMKIGEEASLGQSGDLESRRLQGVCRGNPR